MNNVLQHTITADHIMIKKNNSLLGRESNECKGNKKLFKSDLKDVLESELLMELGSLSKEEA